MRVAQKVETIREDLGSYGTVLADEGVTVAGLVPPAERGRHMGLLGAAYGLSTLVGPLAEVALALVRPARVRQEEERLRAEVREILAAEAARKPLS